MLKGQLRTILIAACAVTAISATAEAQWWQHHPRYLHAMSDLRMAYWLVAHHEQRNPLQRPEERRALKEIARAYQDLKDVSIVDNKDIHDQPPADMNFYDRRGRLQHAVELLREARADVQGEEEDPAARGFRFGALRDIDKAIRATEDAMHAWF